MFRNFLANSSAILLKKQSTLLSAATVIMFTVLISRVLGLMRDRLLAGFFSVDELGIYFAAFRLPNLLFELLVMGALATAFIPVFTKHLSQEGETRAFAIAAQIINLGFLTVIVLMLPLLIFTRPISYLLVPGFSESQRELMVSFTRIMLVGQLLPMVIGNFVTGILQSFQRFLLPALAPVVYNIGIILGILLFRSSLGLYSAVWGVALGAVFYLVIQLPLLFKLGYRHNWQLKLHEPGVRQVVKLMLPRTFGLAVSQIDTTVDLMLASYLGARSITIFNFAQHLQQLPIGLFGATFAQAALPTLSITGAKTDLVEFKKLFLASMHQILFFVLPASAMLIVLRTPIVRLVFGAARFDWDATVTTGQTLSFFAVSIFAQSLVQLYARGFYALLDTKTPVIIGIFSVVVNTVLSIVLVSILNWPVWSLAVSTSVASILNALLLLVFLYRKISGFDLKALIIPPFKMLIAACTTAVFLYVPMKLFDQLIFDTTRVLDLILLTTVAAISGLSVYIFLAWFLDIEEVATFFKLMQKFKRAPRMIFAEPETLVNDEHSQIP
ncbi:TPA: murein biosynthesis integral membrane protein MurJ [Patescibacteria group bacterium]|nr:MAG: murein biosynthesis integral membrane protein MurJ [Candidatus Gottesmanbacteria bacterium RIFCSPHIGHO2_01_FULL_43_15]HCM37336.1 murein biosynthesis integral membrane protein MurJ [Patescibacteria group bacterium]